MLLYDVIFIHKMPQLRDVISPQRAFRPWCCRSGGSHRADTCTKRSRTPLEAGGGGGNDSKGAEGTGQRAEGVSDGEDCSIIAGTG